MKKQIKELRVLLINPSPENKLFGAEASFLPLGLAYLAAVLEPEVKVVKVLDLTVTPMTLEEFRGYICRLAPDLVGFTAVTPTINTVFKLAEVVKSDIKALTVVGGPHPTALPEESLENGLDVVVRGEGEESIVQLCKNLNSFSKVKGISYKERGKIFHNPSREYIENLDSLPLPARHLFPPLRSYRGQPALARKLPVGTIFTSRGCPFNCHFCFKAVFGRMFRSRSLDNIIREWKELLFTYRVKEIAIGDDAFTTNPDKVIKLCRRVREEGLNIPWSCRGGIRADTASEKLLGEMKKAGCYRVAIGVESGVQEVLDKVGKKVTLAHIEEAFRNARKVGMETTAFFMFGNPGETENMMMETINFANELKPDYAQFTIATPYPGTQLYQTVKKEGKLLVADWNDYGSYERRAYFEIGEVTEKLLLEIQRQAYRIFYLNPGYICRKIRQPATYLRLGRKVRAFCKFLS